MNTEYHPRILRLSSGYNTPTTSTSSSVAPTPTQQSRRPSHSSTHKNDFATADDKTHKTLNGSIKKMWNDIKQHAADHHRSVNVAYAASYGAGTTRL
jgi:hypothetical protein